MLRSAMARIASIRPTPICISWRSRANSWASGPVVFLATCMHGGVEAEPGLHGDREQVERVGQRALHQRLTLLSGVVEQDVRAGRSRRRRTAAVIRADPERAAARIRACRASARPPSTAEPEHLEPDDPAHVPAGGVAGDVEPVLDPLGGVGPDQAAADADQALPQRRDDPLGERPVELRPAARRAPASRAWIAARERATPRRSVVTTPTRDSVRARAPKTSSPPASRRSVGTCQTSTFTSRDMNQLPTASRNTARGRASASPAARCRAGGRKSRLATSM